MALPGQTLRGDEGASFHATLGTLWAGLCPSHGGEGEEPMLPGSSQHPSPPSPAQRVHAAGSGSSAMTHRLFKHSLLTPLIPLFSPARPAATLPGGGPEPANCASELQCASPSPRVLFPGVVLGAAGPCRAVWEGAVSSSTLCPFPFAISSQTISILD